MIGNLFNALFVSISVGGFALDSSVDHRAKNTITESTSWVTGEECNVYYSDSYSGHFSYSTAYSSYEVLSYGEGVIDGDDFSEDILSWYTFASMFESVPVVNSTNDSFMFALQSLTTSPLYNSDVYDGVFGVGMRVGVPIRSEVTAIEIRSNVAMLIFPYSTSNVGEVVPEAYISGSNLTAQNSLGIYDTSYYSHLWITTDTTWDDDDSDYMPVKLSQFLILFAQTDGSSLRWVCDLEFSFQLISGGEDIYAQGYNQGYAVGYGRGYDSGYSAGYTEGLSLTENGDFMSLFNGIADTPLRFIYGLFNFELFGVNVLIIVLSLLTFVIVFHIIKKVWK